MKYVKHLPYLLSAVLFLMAVLYSLNTQADGGLMGGDIDTPSSPSSSPGDVSGGGGGGSSLESFINLDASCLDLRVYGWCPFTDALAISHYYPVALVELIRSPGDVSFGGEVNNKYMASRTKKRVQNGYEVRIWDIGPLVDKLAQCILCTSVEAQGAKVLEGLSTDVFANLGNQLSNLGVDLANSARSEGNECGPSPKQIKNAIDKFNKSSPIDLFYTTELDIINWRTGCRDLTKAAMISSFKCFYNDVVGDFGIDGFGSNDDECVGSWGSVYPRQYRAVNTEVVSAAYSGWRGLHISNHDLKNYKYYFGMNSKLQHAWPKVGECFKPGRTAIFVEKGTFSSFNGNYAFIYWAPVGCCRSMSVIAACRTLLATQSAAGGVTGGGIGNTPSTGEIVGGP